MDVASRDELDVADVDVVAGVVVAVAVARPYVAYALPPMLVLASRRH